MKGEIIAVGTELLLGEIVNTNAQYLSRTLATLGVDLYYQSVVGDNLGRLVDVLRLALGRSDLVITCGGLGPTGDDLTRDAVARAAGLELVEDSEARRAVEDHYRRRGFPVPALALRQALVPAGARVLRNPAGSAPGFVVETAGRFIVALPGPPRELTSMFERSVRPFIAGLPGRRAQVIVSRVLRVCGLEEALVAERVADLMAGANPTVAPYASPGEVRLRVTAKAADEEAARALIAPVEAAIRDRLGRNVFGVDHETLEAAVGALLRERGMTLALAESCTGGLVGHRITNVPGSSDYFIFGAVVYANEVKQAVLGVPAETLRRWGAVSHETAAAMAEGVRRVAGTDIGIGITGIAGPGGGSPEKPVGTVFFGLATAEGTRTERRLFVGEREAVKERAAQEALTLLWLHLSAGGPSPSREAGG